MDENPPETLWRKHLMIFLMDVSHHVIYPRTYDCMCTGIGIHILEIVFRSKLHIK